jgi:hypothetical protein
MESKEINIITEIPSKEEMEGIYGEDVRLFRTKLTENEKYPNLNFYSFDGDGIDFKNEVQYNIAAIKNIWNEEDEILEETDNKINVGSMKIILIDTAFEKFSIDPFTFYDSHSQCLCDLYEEVLKNDMSARFIHYLDHIEIKPIFKGKELGLTVLQQYITRFIHDGDLFVTKPFPLQWQGKVNTELDKIEFNKDLKSLRKFYRKVGLKRHKKTNHYYYSGNEFSLFNEKN